MAGAMELYEACLSTMGFDLSTHSFTPHHSTPELPSPTVCTVLSNLAATRLATGDVNGAESAWYGALSIDPHHAASHLNLGISLQTAHLATTARLQKAVYHSQAAVRARPGHVSSLQALANAYQSLGDLDSAELYWGMAQREASAVGTTTATTSTAPTRARGGGASLLEALLAPRRAVGSPVGIDGSVGGGEIPKSGSAATCVGGEAQPRTLQLGSTEWQVVSESPIVLRSRDFLEPNDCERLIALAEPRLGPSYTFDQNSESHRSSQNAWLPLALDPALVRLRERAQNVFNLTGGDLMPLLEDLQVVRQGLPARATYAC